ncbi:MAG: SUMF1/EgtB/PvdO family nonheme iron enzyme, partial [Syntrophorhabdaceae bacterium]
MKTKIIIGFLCLLTIHACNFLTPVEDMPTIMTNAVSNINITSARSGGFITSDTSVTVTVKGVCWDTLPDPTIDENFGFTIDGTGSESFISNITALNPSTTYYVRAYASNSKGTGYGNNVSFTTETPNLPLITTDEVSRITLTSASCGGDIASNGSSTIIERGICWDTLPNPTIGSEKLISSSTYYSYSVNLTGLSLGTTYYVRAYATNIYGTGYGNSISFKTKDLDMIYVQGGTFSMGDVWDVGETNEKPTHQVTLDNYYISKYEITQELYEAIIGDNPSYDNDNSNYPVEQVSWFSSIEFCNALSDNKGFDRVYTISGVMATADYSKNGYRLPTEAEWEYAARGMGRDDRKWSGTNDLEDLDLYANYDYWSDNGNYFKYQTVGNMQPNDLGI